MPVVYRYAWLAAWSVVSDLLISSIHEPPSHACSLIVAVPAPVFNPPSFGMYQRHSVIVILLRQFRPIALPVVQFGSPGLSASDRSTDLIWLDAGHQFPEVAWDHFYCLSTLTPSGWLLSDDIEPDKPCGQTLRYFEERGFDVRYLLKRETPEDYLWRPKMLGLVRK